MRHFRRGEMKQSILRTAAFLVCTAIVLWLAGWCLVPKDNRLLCGYKGGAVFGEESETLDIFVLGSSNAAQGIIPIQWWGSRGWAAGCYGEAWLDIYKAAEILAMVLARQSPRVVVLETDMLVSMRHPESEAENCLAGLGEDAFPILRWHDRWKQVTAPGELFAPRNWSWRHNQKGYELITEVSPYQGGEYMLPNPTEREALHPEQRVVLDAMLALCRAGGSRVVLVSVPSAECCNLTRSRAVADWANSRGVPFWDLNLSAGAIGLDWAADTPDGGAHLNLSGAAKVTTALETPLASLTSLPDHRGDPAYDLWEQDYRSYVGDRIYAEQAIK